MPDVAVGQKLWFVPSRYRGQPHEIIVEKIGRKYITADQGTLQLHIGTLVEKSKYDKGIAYVDRIAYQAQQRREARWNVIVTRIQNQWGRPPPGITDDQLKQIETILGIGERMRAALATALAVKGEGGAS